MQSKFEKRAPKFSKMRGSKYVEANLEPKSIGERGKRFMFLILGRGGLRLWVRSQKVEFLGKTLGNENTRLAKHVRSSLSVVAVAVKLFWRRGV